MGCEICRGRILEDVVGVETLNTVLNTSLAVFKMFVWWVFFDAVTSFTAFSNDLNNSSMKDKTSCAVAWADCSIGWTWTWTWTGWTGTGWTGTGCSEVCSDPDWW